MAQEREVCNNIHLHVLAAKVRALYWMEHIQYTPTALLENHDSYLYSVLTLPATGLFTENLSRQRRIDCHADPPSTNHQTLNLSHRLSNSIPRLFDGERWLKRTQVWDQAPSSQSTIHAHTNSLTANSDKLTQWLTGNSNVLKSTTSWHKYIAIYTHAHTLVNVYEILTVKNAYHTR